MIRRQNTTFSKINPKGFALTMFLELFCERPAF